MPTRHSSSPQDVFSCNPALAAIFFMLSAEGPFQSNPFTGTTYVRACPARRLLDWKSLALLLVRGTGLLLLATSDFAWLTRYFPAAPVSATASRRLRTFPAGICVNLMAHDGVDLKDRSADKF